MNFYVNSQGQIIRVDPEDVFQGSVNANTINFVGAFPSTCPVTVAFKLLTGEWTTPASMGMNSDSPLPGIQQPDGTQFNIWRYTIPETVTEYYGTVNLQFYVYAQGISGNGNMIATASSSFEVKKGVPIVLPDPSDDYETLLTQILSALQQLQQADSEGALAAQKSAEAAANSASAAASSATAAEAAQTAAESAQSKAETAAGSAATSATAAQTAQAAAEAAQTAAETAQAGAEQAKDDAQDLVNEAQDIAETTAQETAQNVVNNFVQTGGPFTNGITVDKQITLHENPETDTSESVLQHKEYGFNFYDVKEGADLSGKSLFFDTGTSPLEDSNFNGTSLEPLISFQNGYTLYVNPNVSPSNYSVYMATPTGGISYFYLNGQWIADVYTFTGSGWVVSSVKKENFESDAAQILTDMLVVGTFFVPSRTRFDEGAQVPLTPSGAFDVANKQYVDSTLKTEAGYLQQAIDNEASARAAADTALRNSKYDKTGGTIDGNVQITGDLTVQGTTTTNDTETLAVKDNLIVTNSDGATLSGLSGLIIRTSPTQSYGMVYDPANEGTVKLGLGTYDAETGVFTFATGEGLPVAVRALSTAWNNLHLAAWDAASNQFVDAGKAVADFQEKLTFDSTPTQNSTNPVTSGGVFAALQKKQNTLTEGEGILISDTDVISFDTTVLDDYVTLDTDQTITATKFIQGSGAYVFNIRKSSLSTEDNEPNITKFDGSTIMFQRDTGSDRGALILYTEITGTAYRGLKLPYEAGTLALLSDIPSLDGYAKLSTNEDQTFTNDIFMLRNLDVQMTISASSLEVSRIAVSNRIICDGYIYIDDDGDGKGYYGTNTGNYYGHMFEVMLDMDSYYVANFPAKPLESQETFAFLSDIEPISEQVSDLSQSVDDIYTILQQEVYNAQDIEQEYSSRETADGADIIDGALETVKKIQGATVKTTNLLPFPYLDGASLTQNGVTFTANSDGSVTINGTPTDYVAYRFIADFRGVGEFILSGIPSSANLSFTFTAYNSAGDSIGAVDGLKGQTIQFNTSDYEGYDHALLQIRRGLTGVAINNVTVYPMLNEGSTALPYMPYFSGLKNAYFQGLRSTGRNLIPFPYFDNTKTVSGVTFTVNDDGSLTVNGTATSQVNFFFVSNTNPILTFPIGTVLSLSGCPSGGSGTTFFLNLLSTDHMEGITETGNGGTVTTTKKSYYFYFRVEEGVTLTNAVIRPMLNYGSSALPYEPYISHEISLDAAIELPAWDSINPTTGKRIVQSNTLTFDGTTSWHHTDESKKYNYFKQELINLGGNAKNSTIICNRISTNFRSDMYIQITGLTDNGYATLLIATSRTVYPELTTTAALQQLLSEWATAGNPLTVCYCLYTSTESDIEIEDRLPAYKNGSETVIQGDTDNSEYGAENTLTQNYAEVKGTTGTTEGGNS